MAIGKCGYVDRSAGISLTFTQTTTNPAAIFTVNWARQGVRILKLDWDGALAGSDK